MADCRINIAAKHGLGIEEVEDIMQEFYENPAVWNTDGSLNRESANAYLGKRVEQQKIMNRIESKRLTDNQQKMSNAQEYIESFRKEFSAQKGKEKGYEEAIRSLLVGGSTYVPIKGSMFSVDSRYTGIATEYMSSLRNKLEERPHVITLLGGDSGTVFKERSLRQDAVKAAKKTYQVDTIQEARMAFNDDVVKEMYGVHTGNDDAKFAADVFNEFFERSRSDLNARGAEIGKLENYVPQNHSSELMVKAGKQDWVRYTMNKVDMSRTFPDIVNERRAELIANKQYDTILSGEGFFDEATILKINERLEGVYDNIITGKHSGAGSHIDNQPSFAVGKRVAKRFEGERVLHFKDAQSFIDYRNAYGRAELISAVEQHLDTSARTAALMDVMGSNPEKFMIDIMDYARESIKKDTSLSPKEKEGLSKTLRGDVARRDSSAILNDFKEIMGETREATDVNMAKAGKNIRNVEALGKLGGAAISALADLGVYSQNLRNVSGGFKSIHDVIMDLHRAGTPESKEILAQLNVVADGMSNAMVQRFNGADIEGATGVTSRMVNTMFKMTGLTQWTNNAKAAFALSLANEVGKASSKSWDNIHVGLRNTLERGGFDEARWEALRSVSVKGPDGRMYVTGDSIKTIGNKHIDSLLPERYQEANKPQLQLPERKDFELMEADAEYEARIQAHFKLQDDWVEGWLREHPYVAPERPSNMNDAQWRTFLRKDKIRYEQDAATHLPDKLKVLPEIKRKGKLIETVDAYNKRVRKEMDRFRKERKVWGEERKVAREKARQELEIQYRSYLIEETGNAILEPNARTRSAMLQGTKAGTWTGEAWRMFGQFKSFPLLFTKRILGVGRSGLDGGTLVVHGQSKMRNVMGVAQTGIELWVLGYVSMTIKDALKGKTPKDPTKSNTIVQAFIQSGAAGLFGDFLFSDFNRYGKGVLETFAGPALGDASQLLRAGLQASRGDFEKSWNNARNVARGNIPFGNVWWAKGALDHLVLYNMEELFNPGSMSRREQRLREDYNQSFFVK